MTHIRKPLWLSLTALSLAVSAQCAHAEERESLEALRQTTIGLIDALVDKGVITREAADAMLKQARARAELAQGASTATKPETTAAGKPVQRVPYVSEAMKAQIRNEVKEGAPAGATFGVGAALGAAAVGAWSLLRRK